MLIEKGKSNINETINSSESLVLREQVPIEIVKYLEGIDSVDILNNGINKLTLKKLQDAIDRKELGPGSNILQKCSTSCNSYERCPLAIIKRAPNGFDCPIEKELYKTLLIKYKQAVIEKIKTIEGIEDIDDDPIIHSLIQQVVEGDILYYRNNELISQMGLIEETPSMISADGVVYYSNQESTPLKIRDNILKLRERALKQLLATPEMTQRIKKRRGESSNQTDRENEIMDKISEIINKGKSNNVIDAEILFEHQEKDSPAIKSLL